MLESTVSSYLEVTLSNPIKKNYFKLTEISIFYAYSFKNLSYENCFAKQHGLQHVKPQRHIVILLDSFTQDWQRISQLARLALT